jgi:hypothetical protein
LTKIEKLPACSTIKNITLNTFLCSLLLNQNSQIYLIYKHSKKYVLFSLVIGPLTVTRLFLSMDHKHNIEKYTFIHVAMLLYKIMPYYLAVQMDNKKNKYCNQIHKSVNNSLALLL